MQALVAVFVLAIAFGMPTLAHAEESPAAAVAGDLQLRTEQTLDVMLFDTGYFIASIAETEPYMTPSNRERLVDMMARELDADRAAAARAYMSTFDERFGVALSRARPGIVTRVADGLRRAVSAEELSALEQFVLGEETTRLFRRMIQQWIDRGGGDEAMNVSGYTAAELSAIDTFMSGPGGRVLNGDAIEALIVAELRGFVPAFEREFFSGLCMAAGQECPAWTRN